MNELVQKIIDAANANGGKITYPVFLETLTYQERQLLPRAIKLAKSQKKIKSYLVWDEATVSNTHYLEIYTEEAAPAPAEGGQS